LAEAYLNEISYNYDIVFRLLSLVYGSNVIGTLKKHFFEGGISQLNYGLELADEILDEDIKPILFPLLEDISLEERLKKLEYYFIQPKLKKENVLRSTLTQDFNTLSLFPRACAIHYILKNNLKDYADELVFNAYHAEPIISQTAIFVLARIHPDILQQLSQEEKSNKEFSERLNNISELNEAELFFHKYVKLKAYPVFKELSEYVSLQLAHGAELIQVKKDDMLEIREVADRSKLLLTNQEVLKGDNNCVISCYENLVNLELLVDNGISGITSDADAQFWFFRNETVRDLLYDHVDITNTYLKVIENIQIEKG
jgi:hypothetical protein